MFLITLMILVGVAFLAFVAITLAGIHKSGAFPTQGEYRGVPCPERGGAEAVVSLEPASSGSAARILSCSNWPERQNCNQGCLRHLSRTGATA